MRSFVTALCAAGVVAAAGAANAATVTVSFDVAPGSWSGPLAIPAAFGLPSDPAFSGTFTYDRLAAGPNLLLLGAAAFNLIQTFDLTVGDQTFTKSSLDPSTLVELTFDRNEHPDFALAFTNAAGFSGLVAGHSIAVLQQPGSFTGFECNGCLSYTVAGVPEPAAWALMIAGFGGVGAAMRRRRRSVLVA